MQRASLSALLLSHSPQYAARENDASRSPPMLQRRADPLRHRQQRRGSGGHKLWPQVKEAYSGTEPIVRERPQAGAKDWNDALRAAQRCEERQGQGQEDDRAPGRGRGHGDRDERGRDESALVVDGTGFVPYHRAGAL